MATSFEKRRAELGERLRQLRDTAGYTGKEFAGVIGWNAPKVSKIENGRQTASAEDLDAWITALQVPAEVAYELHAELATLQREYVSWKERLRVGNRAVQEEAIEREANARVIRAVDVGVVPGLVQTADYARHVLLAVANLHGSKRDITEGVRTRMRRQQVLYEPGKTIEILMAYSALLHSPAPPDVMAGQLHRLIATIGIPNVRFGVLRPHVRLPYPLTHGYWIVDELVMLEQVHGEVIVHDPDEVAKYARLTDMLWSPKITAEGDEARTLLLEVLEQAQAGIEGK
ncbi:helix-turn-helix domain-containing protein [Prauserella muralis]|uniref:Transcriptional regulator n=1 Tax=Prauserella muralis TaxID=588067 RepID=A0A2V4ALG8_9PSEU|nr:helix-turn-helix transcriptional regulator [Prauserella muralis]PXY21107.1 transcriptional regulator [Prauserella muralis]TWE30192.1 transcriptional regulator with XRE-family HTH domain [Prauserella muralis]